MVSGETSNYANNGDEVVTLCPTSSTNLSRISFVSFSLEDGFDFLSVFDGPSTASPLLGAFTGNTVLPVITASESNLSGCLTLSFTSDDIATMPGFVADISCTLRADLCPNDPNKTQPGICGCGVADTDTDNDGTPDCNDACPSDPNKTAPGACGCGVADTDTNNDGMPDCIDACPNDPNKTQPGACGCGVPDTDTDNDGTPDCKDACPSDPNKTQPGACGCGVPDTDTDNDGTPDCKDACPSDPNKTQPGACGCGVADTDTDNDGTPDCNDVCPSDPNKTAPGACGCGVADTDTDNDGTPDCNDACPNDPNNDADSDGVCGNVDNCPTTANPDQADLDQDGKGDACDPNIDINPDIDGDGVPNEYDCAPTDKKNNKWLVCHNGQTICIAQSAVQVHLKHGDYLGSCTPLAAIASAKSKFLLQPRRNSLLPHQACIPIQLAERSLCSCKMPQQVWHRCW